MKKIIILLLLFSVKVSSQVTLQTVYETPDSQINLYIVSQGFTTNSMTDFDSYVTGFLGYLWSQAPYSTMQNRFRVITVKVPASTEHVPGATFLFNNFTVQPVNSFICVPSNNQEFSQYQSAECLNDFDTRMDNLIPSLTGFNSKSYILAVFNNNYYTARGGRYTFVTNYCNSAYMYKVLVHEFSHTFGLLGDEYGKTPTLPYQQDNFCNISYVAGVPQFISPNDFPLFHDRNVTSRTTSTDLPWNYLLGTNYPVCIPSVDISGCSNTTDIGLFAGANYVDTGWYRPRNTCIMRDLGGTISFCQVCSDLITERVNEHLCDATNNVIENFIFRHQYITHWRKASSILTSNSIIGNTISVNYVSGNSITLTAGFHGRSGSDFRAYIGDCSIINLQNSYKASVVKSDQISRSEKPVFGDNSGDQWKKRLTAVPNPTANSATVTLENALINKIVLSAFDGKILLTKGGIHNCTFELNMSQYQKGIYVITVESDNGKIYNEKLIKD